MKREELARLRLAAQQLVRPRFTKPAELVAYLGAVQAQDYAASKWAVGLRLSGATTDVAIEEALARGELVRTHALRGTWQLVAPEDLRWIVALVGPRVLASNKGRWKELGLDAAIFRRSNAAFERALRSGDHLTRPEMVEALQSAGVSAEGQRLPYLIQHAELEGLICSGARRGKQFTWALVDRHVPTKGPKLQREEAIAELARRYFQSRGPATAEDFAWWSGLSLGDARKGVEEIRAELDSAVVEGATCWFGKDLAPGRASRTVHLLPAFDEYLVAYRDRTGILDPAFAKRVNEGGGMLRPIVVVNGQVAGLWKRTLKRTGVEVSVELLQPLDVAALAALEEASRRYGAFLGASVALAIG